MARRRGPVGPPSGKSFWQKYQWFIIAGVALFFVITVIAPALTNTPADDTGAEATPGAESPTTVQGELSFLANYPGARDHIEFPTRASSYRTNPPTSGPHWNVPGVAPMDWGIYKQRQADEALVHNMEHGGIVIYYRDTATPDVVSDIETFVQNQPSGVRGFVVTPGPASLPATIAVAAWEYYVLLAQFDETVMNAFVAAHYDRGPETLDGTLR